MGMSGWKCAALINESHQFWTGHIAGIQFVESEASLLDQRIDGDIEVATTGDSFPDRCEPMLPHSRAVVRRQAMFDKEQAAPGPQYTADFAKRASGIRYAAKRPRHDHGVDGCVDQRNGFGGGCNERYGPGASVRPAARHGGKPWCGLKADDLPGSTRIERQICPGSDADFQHAAFGLRNDALAVGHKMSVAHRKRNEVWQNAVVIKVHGSSDHSGGLACRSTPARQLGDAAPAAAGQAAGIGCTTSGQALRPVGQCKPVESMEDKFY